MDIAEVLDRLENVEQLDLPAVRLILELGQSQPTVEQLAELHPEIEKAIDALGKHSESVKETVSRCKKLQPSPSNWTPLGF